MLTHRRFAPLVQRLPGGIPVRSGVVPPGSRKIISWNLLRRTGAAVDCLVALIEREQPDLLLMQEATKEIAALQARVGGEYAWTPMPGRIHGLAIWSRRPWDNPPSVVALPAGAMFDRICQVLDLGEFGIANVHLSHGQVLNRRQLRRIELSLPARAAVLGDYNLVGPALLPGFRDVGPRRPTHAMAELLPLRIDRCLVRGLVCHERAVLPRGASDHRPIVVHLAPAASRAAEPIALGAGADPFEDPAQARPRLAAHERAGLRGMAAAVGRLRRATGRAAHVS